MFTLKEILLVWYWNGSDCTFIWLLYFYLLFSLILGLLFFNELGFYGWEHTQACELSWTAFRYTHACIFSSCWGTIGICSFQLVWAWLFEYWDSSLFCRGCIILKGKFLFGSERASILYIFLWTFHITNSFNEPKNTESLNYTLCMAFLIDFVVSFDLFYVFGEIYLLTGTF